MACTYFVAGLVALWLVLYENCHLAIAIVEILLCIKLRYVHTKTAIYQDWYTLIEQSPCMNYCNTAVVPAQKLKMHVDCTKGAITRKLATA